MQTLSIFFTLTSPLVATALTMLLGSSLGERVATVGITGMAVSAVCAILTLSLSFQADPIELTVPGLPGVATPLLLIDRLACVMIVLITVISLVILVYSRQYMQGDRKYARFFGLLCLLTVFLLSLVTSRHLLWLFMSWHMVTWILKALITFNRTSPAAQEAGRTTLMVQGIGDAALLGGIVLIYESFGTFDLPTLFERLTRHEALTRLGVGSWWEMDAVTVITIALVLSVMTKSAQFPFHIWLPGTIEAPTPVSAMLHAGIVNAGGFLVNRMAPLFAASPPALHLLFLVGSLTALIGASTMLTQSSVKRTLVYSTMGQMGYMVMECGLGAFALAIFHLCAHGLFKATLFLNSGANIRKARQEFKVPGHHAIQSTSGFTLMPWATGLGITLILPLVILLVAHGLVRISLFEVQGTIIFLFFAWVTSAQAIFSLYRSNAIASGKMSVTMIGALMLIGLTYLWAGEAFTHFLYHVPGQAAAYFRSAAWPNGLFDAFVVVSALLVISVWIIIYAKAHGWRPILSARLDSIRTKLYVAFFNGLYADELLRMLLSSSKNRPLRHRASVR